MSNYTKSTNFATKDNLTPGDPLKVVRGTEIDTEFNNISTAIATKTDNSAAAITGGSITGITDLAIADGGTGASTATAALNNLLPSQTGNSSKYLQTDGTNATWDAISINTGDITGTLPVANGGTGITSFGTGIATFLGTPSSANLASAVTDETGSGALVFANTPTLVAPILGTPTSGNFSSGSFTWPTFNQNTTGTAAGLSATLAIASGGTGQTTANAAFNALAPSQTSASGKYLKSDGTNTSWDALDISTADITGTLPVANGGTGVTSSTGTGSVVLSNSPTLVTPILGTPQSGNFSTGTFTWPTFNQNTTGTAAGLSATLATTSGGTGLTSFTSGGVVYASSSSALATGSALSFNGTSLGVGIGVAASEGQLHLNNASGADLVLSRTNGASSGLLGRIRFGNTDVDSAMSEISSEQNGASNSSNLIFSTQASGGATAEGFRLTSTSLYTASGIKVGFGTSSPSSFLGDANNLVVGTGTGSNGLSIYSGTASLGRIAFADGTTGGDPYAGLIDYSHSDNSMRFSTNGGTEALRISSSQNIGVGVTPSAWGSDYKAMQLGGGSLSSYSDNNYIELRQNSYYSSGYKYVNTGSASGYTQTAGRHEWSSAASGTAGNAISYTLVLAVEKDKSLALQGASSATGTGITFPATQSASSNANTLDDYEEGTWTPTNTQSVSMTVNAATYTKVGRFVFVTFDLEVASNSNTNNLNINLPFSVSENCSGALGYNTNNDGVRVTVDTAGIFQIRTAANAIQTCANYSLQRFWGSVTFPTST